MRLEEKIFSFEFNLVYIKVSQIFYIVNILKYPANAGYFSSAVIPAHEPESRVSLLEVNSTCEVIIPLDSGSLLRQGYAGQTSPG
jgi:hypothetical protein